jgi:GGDEF domain-containing protein
VEVLNSNRIRREALDIAGLGEGAQDEYEISAVALPEASVLEVAVAGPNPDMAAALANAAAAQTISYVGQTYDIYRIELLDPAVPPETPISPTPVRDASLALFLGLVLGSVLAILRDQIQQPIAGKLRHWNARDHASSAYKRTYLENQLERLLPEEADHLVFGSVRLDGLSRLEVPAHVMQNLQRRIVANIRDELLGRDIIARWDDNSFAFLMRQIFQQEEARIRLDRLQQALSEPIEVYPGGEVMNLSPRIAAVVGQPNDTVTALIERMASATVQAGKNGNGSRPLINLEDVHHQSVS